MTQNNSNSSNNFSGLSFLERLHVWLPLLLAVMLALGTWLGLQLRSQNRQSYVIVSDSDYKGKHAQGIGKVEEILRFIDARYLEGVNADNLEDAAIEGLLKKLDPHSNYIPKSEIQSVNEQLAGGFEGIGVEFFILDDTVYVVGVVPEGPSDIAGIKVGDKFNKVQDSLVAGVGIQSKDIIEKLKGKEGSKVTLEVIRRGQAQPIKIEITRGQIPVKSVDAAFMVDKKIGYIKVSRFSNKTYKEFMKALEDLVQNNKMEDLVIDLRHNPGGYLNEATDILNQIFESKKLLVYTEGRSYKRKEYHSTGRAYFKIGKVVILIDESSASASEIMAGAIQDNDRGLIIGRRSYGKGLVQEQYELSDKSALRLTVARYYTPSGRLIQRPYDKGKDEYTEDFSHRYSSGELFHRDSIKVLDSTEYKTTSGRVVYGGGGIIPDIFIPLDTVTRNSYFLAINNYIPQFVYRYMDKNFQDLERYKTVEEFVQKFQTSNKLLEEFIDYTVKKGVARNETSLFAAQSRVKALLKAYIGQQLFRAQGFHQSLISVDVELKRAIEEINRK